jgi:hypothetical protein
VDCDQIGGDYPQARQNCENDAEDKSGLEKRFSRIVSLGDDVEDPAEPLAHGSEDRPSDWAENHR